MKLVFHHRAHADVEQILLYYEEFGGQNVAEGFYQEFLKMVKRAAAHPDRYPIRIRDIRRINFKTYPYHVLFRVVDDCVRILVVRHHKRKPSFGISRR